MRRLLQSAAIAAMAIGVAACETRSDTADGAATGDADTMTAAAPAPAPAAPAPGPGPEAEGVAVQLEALNNSGASGRVVFVPAANGATVRLTVESSDSAATGGRRHMAHVHSGSCDNIGAVVAPLEPVMSDAAGGPTSTTMLTQDMATLGNGAHIVVAHAAGGAPGRPIACAAIPAQQPDSATAI